MQVTSALVGVVAFTITIAIFTLLNSKGSCIILITGESARVINCEPSKELVELVRYLKPYAHGLG
ncbi:triple gene block 3 [Pomes virus Greece]|nr:triple gene block 3 [Pomes virus Greece]